MKTVRRFDIGATKAPVKMANGWLRADGFLTRTGVFSYAQPDGTIRRELRPPEEVFKPDALASFEMVPVTDDHPPEPLDSTNTKRFAVGHVGEQVKADGDFVRASVLVTDAEVVHKVMGGKSELSCGYFTDLDETPGVWKDATGAEHPYDVIQRNIRGNHLAIVKTGRAGPDARLKLDAADAMQVAAPPASKTPPGPVPIPPERQVPVKKIKIDGVEYEVTEQVAQAFEKHSTTVGDQVKALELARADSAKAVDSLKGDLTKATTEAEKAKARADQAEADLKTEKAARTDAASPAKVAEMVKARVALETKAVTVLGSEAKLDALDTLGVQAAVLKKLCPDLKLDGLSPVYIEARFDGAMEAFSASNPDLANARRPAGGGNRQDDQPLDADAAREKYKADKRDAWKKPATK